MKDILKTLIEIPTISSDLASNTLAIDYIEDFVGRRGMHTVRHSFNGRPALVATTQPTKTPKILLAGHIDVVPAPASAFVMAEKDGKLYGRGAYDMKGAIATYLQIIDDLQDKLTAYDLGIMITADEELGGTEGVQPLLELGYRPQACVLPDGGTNWKLESAAKGLLWYRLTATGVTAHGSRPWEGESAISKITRTTDAITRKLFAQQDATTNTVSVGVIKGGEATNQVPDYCEAELDIRFISATEETRIRHEVEIMCAEHDVHATIISHGTAFSVDLSNPYVLAWGRSFEKIMRQPLQTVTSLGGSDARWFAAKGIPTLVTYPAGGNLHSDNEWIGTDALYHLKDIIRDFIESTARIAPPRTETIALEPVQTAAHKPGKSLTQPQ